MKRPKPERARELKEELYRGIDSGTLDMRKASRLMRKVLGMSRVDYARSVLKISPRILSEFELGKGNPTLATLQKIAAPFGLEVGFVRRVNSGSKDTGELD